MSISKSIFQKKFKDVIRKITSLTAEDRLSWEYLDENEDLIKELNLIEYTDGLPGYFSYIFDNSNSFYCYDESKNTYLVFVESHEGPYLQIVPHTFKSMSTINEDSFPDAVEELYLLRAEIKHHFPNSEDYMDYLLSL